MSEGKKKKALIAEDDAGVDILLKKVMEMQGYEVTLTAHGAKAIGHLQNEQFDLVITDRTLLDGPMGVKICQLAKEQKIPTLMFTGYPDEARREIAEEKLDVPVLGKPLNIAAVQDAVKQEEAAKEALMAKYVTSLVGTAQEIETRESAQPRLATLPAEKKVALIVSPMNDFLGFAKNELKWANYTLHVAHDAQEAEKILESISPDLVLATANVPTSTRQELPNSYGGAIEALAAARRKSPKSGLMISMPDADELPPRQILQHDLGHVCRTTTSQLQPYTFQFDRTQAEANALMRYEANQAREAANKQRPPRLDAGKSSDELPPPRRRYGLPKPRSLQAPEDDTIAKLPGGYLSL